MATRLSRFNWASLLLGIVALIAAVTAFRDPAANLLALTIFFGVTALVRGILQIYARFALKNVPGVSPNVFLFLGILNVIFAVLLLTNLWVGMVVLPTLFAIWFILESVLGLMSSGATRIIGNGYYWFRIVLCILGSGVGVWLLANPVEAAFTMAFLVGFYFMLMAIGCFIEAFGGREWRFLGETSSSGG